MAVGLPAASEMSTRRIRHIVALCATLVALPSVAACTDSGKSTTLTVEQISGKWSGEAGQKLELNTDKTFTAANLHIDTNILSLCKNDHPDGGTWSFYIDEGSSVRTSSEADSGKSLSIRFSKPSGQDFSCSVEIDARNRNDHIELCVTEDPGSPCASENYLIRQKD